MIWPLKKGGKQDTQLGVVLDPRHGGSVAVIQHAGSRLRLRHCASCRAPDDGDWRPELAALLDDRREPVNAVHEKTMFPEETLYLFTSYGPLAMYGPDKNIASVLDAEGLHGLIEPERRS